MKRIGRAALLFLSFALAASGSAWANPHGGGGGGHWGGGGHMGGGHWGGHVHNGHSHTSVGVAIGVPLGAPFYYPPLYYSYPPVVTAPVSPPVYIAQDQPQSSDYWWYYCPQSQNYYPYVTQCPQGWQRVSPQPPDLQ